MKYLLALAIFATSALSLQRNSAIAEFQEEFQSRRSVAQKQWWLEFFSGKYSKNDRKNFVEVHGKCMEYLGGGDCYSDQTCNSCYYNAATARNPDKGAEQLRLCWSGPCKNVNFRPACMAFGDWCADQIFENRDLFNKDLMKAFGL